MKYVLRVFNYFSITFSLLTFHSAVSSHYLLPEQLYYDVTFYDINLMVDMNDNSIIGQVRIDGTVVHDGTAAIILNLFDHMMVDSVKSQSQLLSYQHAATLLSIDLPQPLNTGELFSLQVYYHGSPMQGTPAGYGLIFTSYNNQKLVYSYNWPYYANSYLPCKDHPSDKTDSLRLAITVPDLYTVAGNGVLDSTVSLPGNLLKYIWKSNYPITPYHLSINIHPFLETQSTYASAVSGDISLQYYLFSNHAAAAQLQLNQLVPKIHEAFEAKFGGFPFPAEKYGICESVISGGMEHQTLLTMNYPSFFSDIVIHESAHEYFGNMISISDWGHIWLSEGFATYSQAIYREYWEGEAGYEQEISQHMSGAGNGTIYVSDPSNPNNIIPYNLVYLKASAVLHMLRYIMGDSLFFQMLQDYLTLSPFRYENIDTEQFRIFCESFYGSDLSWFFDQWIFGDGKMAAKYYHYWNDSADSLILKIRSGSSNGIGGTIHSMPVPVLLAVSGYQAADTLWIDSVSLTKKYSLPDTLNFTIQFDPGNKILKTAFTFSDHPELLNAVTQPDSGNIRVEWEPFFDFSGYQLFIWKKEISGSYALLDSLNIQGHQVSVIPPATGTYRVAVRAINANHRTALSDFREVNFSNFPMNKGILLVDETRNGNGSHMLLPTDAAVDSFYSELLSGYTFTQFDVFQAGNLPNLLDFGEYSLIIWHHEVNYQTVVSEIQPDLAVYLEAGGKVIFSGMNYLNNFPMDFLETYLGIEQYVMNSAADFTSAAGMAGFPDLTVDTAKITFPLYNHKLPNVMIFDTTSVTENIYSYISGSLNPLYHLQPAGVRAPSMKDSSVIGATALGFPLYFMEQDSARKFVIKALTDLGIMVGIDRRLSLPVENFRLYSNYPNPFNPVTKILFELNRSTGIDIFIYNLLGEVVRRLFQGNLAVGRHEIEWDGRNDSGVAQASGVYFAKLTAGSQTQAIKIILQR